MRRGFRTAAFAFVVSLLLHAVLLGGVNWSLPRWGEEPPETVFEARLIAEVPTPAPKPVSRPPAAPRPAPPRIEPVPQPEPVPSVEVEPPPVAMAQGADAGSAPVPAGLRPPEPVAVVMDAPLDIEPELPPLNALPLRIDMRFDLHYGLASGEQTLIWVNEGERYTLTSVAAATGLTGVFYRGRFVQTSRGRITPQGLQPEEFWDQRGDSRSSARLDAASGRVALTTASGVTRHFAYRPGMQDALSLFFQLALTAPPPSGELRIAVFNGKKVRRYVFETRGEETLETALGPLRTLHLARTADADGRFEAWLAIDRQYLPVRVLRSDDKGNEMELRVRSIAP